MHKFGTNEGRKLAGQLAIQVYLENGHLNLCVYVSVSVCTAYQTVVISEYCTILMSCTVYDRAAMLATGGLQEAFTSALVNCVSAMDIQWNVTALLATVWLVFVHQKTFDW